MKLKKKDLLGASDPYVKLKLTGDNLPSKKTTVKHKNLNPEWNEEFSLTVKDPESQALHIHVYDWEQVFLSFIDKRLLELYSHYYQKYKFCVRLESMTRWVLMKFN